MLRKILIAGAVVILAAVAAVVVHPPLVYELVFALLEPRACERGLAPVSKIIRLPDSSPEIYESLLANPDGSFIVVASSRGELLRVSEGGTVSLFSRLPKGEFDLASFNGMLGAITRGLDGAVYVSVNARDPGKRGVWRVDAAGRAAHWSLMPPEAGANGIAVDASGDIYIADSTQGMIWKAPAGGGPAREWHRSQLVGEGALLPMPSANGLQIARSRLYVANTQGKRIVSIDIAADGGPANPRVWNEGVAADDFAIASDGRLYLTTHPFNTVVRVAEDEDCAIVADVTSGLAGPTAAVFGVRAHDRGVLYVVNDGGFARAVAGGYPAIIGLDMTTPPPAK